MNKNNIGNSSLESITKIQEIINKSTNENDCLNELQTLAIDFSSDDLMNFVISKVKELKGFDLKEKIDEIRKETNELKKNNANTEFQNKNYGKRIIVDEEGIAEAINAHNERKEAINGLLYEGQIALIAGRGGCGKSFLSLRILHDLSCGINVFNEGEQAPKKVLFLTAEDGIASIGGRLKIIMATNPENRKFKKNGVIYSLTTASETRLLKWNSGDRTSKTTEYHKWLKQEIIDKEIDVLIIDPIASIAGLQDENNNTETTFLIDALNDLITATNGKLAIIGIHHANKTTDSDPYNQIRGASALVAGVRLALVMQYMTPSEEEGKITVKEPCSIFRVAKHNDLTTEQRKQIESKAFFITSKEAEIKDYNMQKNETQSPKKNKGINQRDPFNF